MNTIKKVIIFIIVISIITIGVVIYNIYNNNQINIITQEIKINGLPDEFDGFTILQIADLHSKSFGENQENLINIINEQTFDMIAICGDMQDIHTEGFNEFIQLLEGIENKDEVYYTPGNHGPYPFENDEGFTNFLSDRFKRKNRYLLIEERELTEAGEILQELGVKFLDKAYEIKRGDKSIYVSELLYKSQLDYITNNQYDESGLNIAITHYPMDNSFYEGASGEKIPQYDIVLAAHYHGGQWRIPGIGALYIPNINKAEFFPDEEEVSGLIEYGGIRQYVTRGLGASGSYKFLRFRLFNRPEINLIKFVKE